MAVRASAGGNRQKRQYLFMLTDEERGAADQPVKFCERVPLTEKSNDPVVEEDLRNARAAFINVIDGLWRKPHLAVACNTWLSTRMAHEVRPKGDMYFKSAPPMIKFIDEDWLAMYLVRHSSITQAALEQASVFDPLTPVHLLCFAVRCSTHMKLSKLLICKAMLGYVLEFLMENCGNRLKGLNDRSLQGDGKGGVNWADIGCYKFDFNEEGWATHLTHVPTSTQVAVPEHAKVHTSFVLVKNWSDYEAAVKKRPSDMLLHTYFDEARGPHVRSPVTSSSQAMQEAIAYAQQKQDQHTKTSGALSEPGAKRFKADHKQQQKQASIQKAHAALQRRKSDLEEKRTLSLGSVGGASASGSDGKR